MKHSRVKSILVVILSSFTFFCLQAQPEIRQKKAKGDKVVQGKGGNRPEIFTNISKLTANITLSCPTDNSIIINTIALADMNLHVEYGLNAAELSKKTESISTKIQGPVEIKLENLKPNTSYYYKLIYTINGESNSSTLNQFKTQRKSGSSFSFGIQGDSHPERQGRMFHPDLYRTTIQNAADINPDFYFLIGDDFSIDHIIQKNELSKERVEGMYINQRAYLEPLSKNTPLFLVNGNHEQAARYLLNDTDTSASVLAANARNKFFSQPMPDKFYTGDSEKVKHIGLLRDYYAFEWGDALFVVIDPYWHSKLAVDNIAGSRDKNQRNMWDITLGYVQYNWFKTTLEKSKARFKFVFSHHVSGTGRGGTELAKLYEWGGYSRNGSWEFDKMRPGWSKPIHNLMVDNKVSIFFQGHDHLFCKQELDGIVYQTLPCPADNSYSAFNSNAFSGIKFPNSGFLNVKVNNREVSVEYIGSALNTDDGSRKNKEIIYTYTIRK